jgi:ribonuclease P protein component
MQNPKRYKLPKQNRLCSLTDIDALFASGKGALAYPLRALWKPSDKPGVRFMISVPKKRLRHAVDRVAMRRRIRESYRLLRPDLPEGLNLDLAFVYVAGERSSYARIHAAVGRLLARLNSELSEYSEYSEHF